MCGLVGYVGHAGDRDKEIFSQLLLINTLRGAHGTGLFTTYTAEGKNWFDSTKTVECSGSWVYSQEYDDALLSVKGVKSMMAHSRHATLGKVEEDNSHPFYTKNLTGFHNGTIKGIFDGTTDFETDSEALYNLIEDRGLTEALDHVNDRSYSVAYALQYYDRRDDSMNLIRNSQRPLWIAEMWNNEWFWASERNFLEMVFIRNNIKPKEIKMLPVDALVKFFPFKANRLKNMEMVEDFYKKPPAKITYHTDKYKGYQRFWGGGDWEEEEKKEGKETEEKKVGYKFVRLSNQVFPLAKYVDIVGDGCAVCSFADCVDDMKLDQKFLPNSTTDFICNNCQTDQTYRDFDIDKNQLVKPVYSERYDL